jgi:hypothetical protein
MKIKYNKFSFNNNNGTAIVVKCPECGHGGTFDKIEVSQQDIITNDNKFIVGQRVCPNPACLLHIFFIHQRVENKTFTFPNLKIDFDSKSIPEKIKISFEQAIGAESIDAFIASAIMVRRTLECLCEDRNAKGNTLKDRINDLKGKIILPNELFEALDNLRLLGNDAAHVESKDYEKIGKDEVNVAIELTKEILKASYQYEGLLNKLKSFKKLVS